MVICRQFQFLLSVSWGGARAGGRGQGGARAGPGLERTLTAAVVVNVAVVLVSLDSTVRWRKDVVAVVSCIQVFSLVCSRECCGALATVFYCVPERV